MKRVFGLIAVGLVWTASAMPEAERVRLREDPAKYWNLQELSAAPKFRDCTVPETHCEGMKPLLVSGKGPNGTNAEFFVYYAVPKRRMPAGGWPGLVLVHGGGGTAYPKCVREFQDLGFAVIAIDWLNQMPAPGLSNKTDVARLPLPGGRRQDHVANVANIVLSHSLLRSFPEVNADRTVLAGLSWGSWYSGCVAAVDDRFRGAVAIYCCDFNPYRWYLVNGRFLHAAKIPVWWSLSTNDQNVTPETSRDGFDECARFDGCSIVNNLPHSHVGFEFPSVHRMARHYVGDGKRLPKLGEVVLEDGVARARILDRGEGIAEARIGYTTEVKARSHLCEWKYAPAEIKGNEIVAKIPPHARKFYLAAYEKESRFHDLCGTTKFVILPPAVELTAGGVTYRFSDDAKLQTAREGRTGHELVTEDATWVRVTKSDGKSESPTSLKRDSGGRLVFGFPSGNEIVESVTPFDGGLSFTVEKCTFESPRQVVIANLCPAVTNYIGDMSNVASDDQAGICLRAGDYEAEMDARETRLMVSVPEGFSAVGKRAFLTGGLRKDLVDRLKKLVLATGLAHSKAGGPWSADADVTHGSYMFANMSAADVDTWIRAARLGGLSTIHVYSWEEHLGHYRVNTNKYPRGLADLKAVADRIHDAGLGFSLHTLTGCIDYRDDWVTPKPSKDLIATYRYTLAAPVTDASTEIVVNELPGPKHDTVFTYGSNGNVLVLDGELIAYTGVRREKPYAFTGLTRGWNGTARADHAAGDEVRYLQHRYFAFYPQPDSQLARDLADALAGVINATKADMFYLDGSEGMKTPYGSAKMGSMILDRVDQSKKPVHVEMSSRQRHYWPFRAQFEAWDRHTYAPKSFSELHIESNARGGRMSNFLEPQMGWWSPEPTSPISRGVFLDDVEYFIARNAGVGAAMSLQGIYPSGGVLPVMTAKALALMGWYERFRVAKAFAPDVLKRLGEKGTEGRLRQDAKGIWTYRPVSAYAQRVRGAGVGSRGSFVSPEATEAALRVELFYNLSGPDSAAGVPVIVAKDLEKYARGSAKGVTLKAAAVSDPERGQVVSLKVYNDTASPRGAWTKLVRTVTAPYLDLSAAAGVGFWVRGDGSGAILNVRVSTPREHFRCDADHIVKLDFKGWKYVELLFRERDTELASKLEWEVPYDRSPFQTRMKTKYVSAVGVWLNEIPVSQREGILDSNSEDRASRPASVDIAFGEIRALPLKAAEAEDVSVKLNGKKIEVPFDFAAGDYAELDDGVWSLYTELGVLKKRQAGPALAVAAGQNEYRLKGDVEDAEAFRGEVTFFVKGKPRPALLPLTPALREKVAYEPMMPQEYAPAKGASDLQPLTVRPDEKATLEITLRGPIADPVLTVGDKAIRLPSLPEKKLAVVRDEAVFSGVRPMKLESSAPQAADAVITVSKCYVR